MPRVSDRYRRERRQHLLDAARRCFVRQGFHGTSMEDLLAEAGMSSGAAYGYFASKDDIILAIAEENLGEISTALRAALEAERELTPVEALAGILELIRSRNGENNFARLAVIVWSEAMRNPALGMRLAALAKQYHETFARLSAAHPSHPPVGGRSIAIAANAVVAGFILRLALGGPVTVEQSVEPMRALWPSTAQDGDSSAGSRAKRTRSRSSQNRAVATPDAGR